MKLNLVSCLTFCLRRESVNALLVSMQIRVPGACTWACWRWRFLVNIICVIDPFSVSFGTETAGSYFKRIYVVKEMLFRCTNRQPVQNFPRLIALVPLHSVRRPLCRFFGTLQGNGSSPTSTLTNLSTTSTLGAGTGPGKLHTCAYISLWLDKRQRCVSQLVESGFTWKILRVALAPSKSFSTFN